MGGTGRIGLATARRFLDDGAVVAVCGRTGQTLEKARGILDELHPQRAWSLAADATVLGNVDAVFDQLTENARAPKVLTAACHLDANRAGQLLEESYDDYLRRVGVLYR